MLLFKNINFKRQENKLPVLLLLFIFKQNNEKINPYDDIHWFWISPAQSPSRT